MIKSILTTALAILILLGAGIFENYQVSKTFLTFNEFLQQTQLKLESESATVLDCEALEKFWLEKKRTLHVWIPHNDIKEIDLWMAECVAYTRAGDFTEAVCKIKVLKILASQVPFNFTLKLENIF